MNVRMLNRSAIIVFFMLSLIFVFPCYANKNNIARSVTNSGNHTWISVNNGLTSLQIPTLVSYNDSLYVGTNVGGIFRSSDGGDSWMAINKGLPSYLPVNVLYSSNKTLYAGADSVSDSGLYKSKDGGDTWIVNEKFQGYSVKALCAHNGNLYAGATTSGMVIQGGVFRSKDGGDTWETVNKGLPNI